MDTLERKGKHKVSPDFLEIPEWGYNLKFAAKDSITIAYNKKELLLTKLPHYKTQMGTGFFARLWTDSKILTWWYNPDYNPYVTLWEIIDLIGCNVKCTIDVDMSVVGNIADYTVVFSKDRDTIVREPLKELKYNSIPYGYNNTRERVFHTMSPLEKKKREKENASIREWKHQYYLEDCKVWNKLIGNMDVAEYHILIN